jgi:hypothetical protein
MASCDRDVIVVSMRVAAAFLFVLAFAGHAAAEPVHVDDPFEDLYPKPSHETAKPLGRWYGWQILAVDAGLLAVWATWPAWKFDGTALLAVDAIAFNLAAPIVHGAHGRGPAAGGSVLLHMAAPLVGALAGAVGDAASALCLGRVACSAATPGMDAWAGALAGAGFATLIDAAALAWEDKKSESDAVSWSVGPRMARGGGMLTVSVFF